MTHPTAVPESDGAAADSIEPSRDAPQDPLEALRHPPDRDATWSRRSAVAQIPVVWLRQRFGAEPGRMLGGLAVVIAVGVAGWWLVRPPQPPVETLLPMATAPVASNPSIASSAPSAPPLESLVVHVAGAVAQPGLYELASGARVADAVAAAGGVTASADERTLNLAARVVDGQRVYIVAVGETAPPAAVNGAAGSGEGAGDVGPVDLNRATADELEELPGVGPATAAAIIEHRERQPFVIVDDLLDVAGIGEATLARLRPLVMV